MTISANADGIKTTEKHQGWLKKLGGKLKIWKERYYVLTDTHLCYFTGTDRKKLLGEFALSGAKIESDPGDVEHNGDKSCLLLLKINGNSSLLPTGQQLHSQDQQQIILCAPSPRERKVWLRAIRKVLYLQQGGALFGTHLEEVFKYSKSSNEYLPRVVYETVKFIRENGLDTEGIFRKCGKQNAIQALADLYDSAAPGPILIPNEHDVHLVSGLLKYYLRELPEPVIPYKYYDKLKASGYRIADGDDLPEYIDIFQKLPPPNYNLLKYLCQFLFEVSEHEKQNRMSISSLASMFAPNFLRQQEEDLHIEMSASQLINHTMTEFIKAYQILFPFPLKSPELSMLQVDQGLNTTKVLIQSNTSSPLRISSWNNDMKMSTQSQMTESGICDKPSGFPFWSSENTTNNCTIENKCNNHKLHPTFSNNVNNNSDRINQMNKLDHKSAVLNNIRSSRDTHNTTLTTTTPTTLATTNNIVMRPHKRHYLHKSLTTRIDMNHSAEQKESRIQLRKLHTESGEYELGSLVGESEENLHCTGINGTHSSNDTKTDSSELTIIEDRREDMDNLIVAHTDINSMKMTEKSFNSLPSHQNNSELVKSSVKDRPIIPTHWSINTDKKKLPMESKTVKQKDSNETYASFNLDVLSKIYLNSEKVAQLNTNENNTFDNTTNTEITLTAGVPTDSLHYNGYYYSQSDFPKKVIHTKEFNASKKHDKAIRSESLDSHSPVEQIRYWRSVAAAAQANAAGQLARVDKLTQEVTRLRWDLSISHMENNLLRQNLASVQAELDQIHQISNSTVKRDKTMRHTLSP